jgi:hypothetical protein
MRAEPAASARAFTSWNTLRMNGGSPVQSM